MSGVAKVKHKVIFVSQPFVNQLDRNFRSFLGCFFLNDSDLSDSEQPLEDGSWSVSAFLLPKKFLTSLCFDILAALYF